MFATVSPLPFVPLMIGPLGMQEMLIILVVALIVFGPRKLPQIGKTLGKSIAEFRRTSTELRSTLEREVQMEEFRAARNEVSGLQKEVTNLGQGLDPKPGSPSSGAAAAESASGDDSGSRAASAPAGTEPEGEADGAPVSEPASSAADASAGAAAAENAPDPETAGAPGK